MDLTSLLSSAAEGKVTLSPQEKVAQFEAALSQKIETINKIMAAHAPQYVLANIPDTGGPYQGQPYTYGSTLAVVDKAMLDLYTQKNDVGSLLPIQSGDRKIIIQPAIKYENTGDVMTYCTFGEWNLFRPLTVEEYGDGRKPDTPPDVDQLIAKIMPSVMSVMPRNIREAYEAQLAAADASTPDMQNS